MIEQNTGTLVRFTRNNLLRHIMIIFINLIETPSSDQPNKFWRFVKSKRKDNIGINTLEIIIMVKQNNVLNDYFHSIFTLEKLDFFT